MWTIIPVLLVINIPLGYFICRRYEIRSYGKILLVGVAQYVTSSLAVATLLVFASESKPPDNPVFSAFYLGLAGVAIFAVFVVPIILVYAYILYVQFKKLPKSDENRA